MITSISRSQAQVQDESQLRSLVRSDLGTELPLHISLSRPIVLLTHQRQPFNDALSTAIWKSDVRP